VLGWICVRECAGACVHVHAAVFMQVLVWGKQSMCMCVRCVCRDHDVSIGIIRSRSMCCWVAFGFAMSLWMKRWWKDGWKSKESPGAVGTGTKGSDREL